MGKKSRGDTIARQWEILKMLPASGAGLTIADIHKALADLGHRVERRTVERDFEMLSAQLPLKCNDKSVPVGWRWADGAETNLAAMGISEALSLTLVAGELKRLFPASLYTPLESRLQQARKLLESKEGKSKVAGWKRKVRSIPRHLELIPPVIKPKVLETVHDALFSDVKLEFGYESVRSILESEGVKKRTVDPTGLIQRGSVTYLVAYDLVDNYQKQFALHRMTAVRKLDGEPTGRHDVDLDGFIAKDRHEVGDSTPIRLRARVTKHLANLLRETPLTRKMAFVEEPGEKFVISADVRWNLALERWIMGHGDNIEVLGPAGIRELIHQKASNLYDAYADAQNAASRRNKF